MFRCFTSASYRISGSLTSASSARFFAGGKPSNQKKKRKLRRKRIKTVHNEYWTAHNNEEKRRLRLLRLSRLHDAAKWKRLLAMGDESWFTSENLRHHGPMRQYMLRCDGWCPVSALREMYIDELQYWVTTKTLALAFNCELAADRYTVHTDRGLWEECYKQYENDFVDPVDQEEDEEDEYPTTMLDVLEGYNVESKDQGNGSLGVGNTRKADTDELDYRSSLDIKVQQGPQSELIERLPVDMYEAEDDLDYAWEYTDEDDHQMLEQSFLDDEDGVDEEDGVEEKYRFAMVRHKDFTLEDLQEIELDNKRRFEALTTDHPHLYDDEAIKFGWYLRVPSYNSDLVLDPKPKVDIDAKLQSLLARNKVS